MIDIRRQRSRAILMLSFTTTLGFALGACFDGLDAEGLPCETDAQCGPLLACEDNYCGGVVACADGSKIQVPLLCDGTPDCADGSDEDTTSCGIATPNQCEAEPDQTLAYIEGPQFTGAARPIKVVAENFVDGGKDDMLVAGVDGMFVKIISTGMGAGTEAEYYLNGDSPSFGSRTVADFEVADLEGDGDLDIVVITDGEGVGVHVFENNGQDVPAAFGPAADLPLDVTVRGMELGRFDDDNWIDLVAIVDLGDMKGQVFTAVGDPEAANLDSNYFSPEFSTVQLDYEEFFDSAATDVDGDGLDDLIVTGEAASGPAMWVVRRNGTGVVAWQEPDEQTTPGPLVDIGLGSLDADPRVDFVAIVDDVRLVPFLNVNGNFMPGSPVEDFGMGLSGVTIADINCDGLSDWLVNVANPAEVRIWLGDGDGSVVSDIELTIPSVGVPSGGLAVSHVDLDQTWDIVQAVDAGSQLPDPGIRVWFTSDPLAGDAP